MLKKIVLLLLIGLSTTLSAQFIYGDLLPDAPALSARGEHAVGVRTITITNPDQPNVAAGAKEGKFDTYDRELKVEVWYPADADLNATIK